LIPSSSSTVNDTPVGSAGGATAGSAGSGTAGGAHPRANAIERTVTGLGYDLVDVEHLARGLLRVTIDRIPGRTYGSPGAPDAGEFITVDDCERVTRQLQLALEVSGLDYARLEVSSPGLDRPLKTEEHYRRFAGQAVSLTLKLPFQNRKHWTGLLEPLDTGDGAWRLVVTEQTAKGSRRKARQEQDVVQALDFRHDEVREMRLVPVVDFKGRRRNTPGHAEGVSDGTTDDRNAAPAADAALNGEQDR
jgi:ribosome maturation factor RimP